MNEAEKDAERTLQTISETSVEQIRSIAGSSSVQAACSAAGLTPHQKIMRAAKNGTGLRLNADEVWVLSMDDAIATAATNDDFGEDVSGR